MSLLLSTLLPAFVVAADLSPAPVAVSARDNRAAVTATAKPPSRVVKVKETKPVPKAKPAPVPAPTPQVVKVQAPSPAPQTSPVAKPPIAAPPVAQTPAPATLDRNAVITRVEQALTKVTSAEGSFTQNDSQGPASGRFYIQRPGKVRFDYSLPEPMYIVSDGVSVSVEEPKRDAYDAVPLSSTPLHLFLRSNVNLKRDGSVRDVSQANGSWFVTLEDATGEAEGKMILEFRAADFELLGWRSVDGAGQETRVRLTDVKTNVKLRPQLFIVKDPSDRDDRR